VSTETRKRPVPFLAPYTGRLRDQSVRNGNPLGWRGWIETDLSANFSHLVGQQVTVSENHSSWNSRKRNHFKGDLGSEFYTTKTEAKLVHSGEVFLNGGEPPDFWGNSEMAEYYGPFLPLSPSDVEFPPAAESSREELLQLAAMAIAQCSPSNPAASLSVTIGEFAKEGLPKMVGSSLKSWLNMSAKDRRKAIGGEYLNYDFGWKPLVNDLRDISHAITHADAIWRQYARDAGKLVRRRYEFPVKRDTKMKDLGLIGPWISPSSSILVNRETYRLDGRVLREHSITKRQWFSGAFTYYVPGVNATSGAIAENVIQAKKLLGLSLTPDVVWNLSPWSWAIDWFANVGDVLENWSNWAIDGQVLAYGYFMEETSSKYTYTYVGDTRMRRAGVRPWSLETSTKTKRRIKATPYGFGLNWDGFSSSQKATIAALGMSRS